jgi:Transposase DDE domain
MVYFTLALWLDFGKGYVRVLTGLLTGPRWARGGWNGYTVLTDGAISLALIGAELDSIAVGERALFERLLPRIGPDTLLMADRGFPSHDLYTKTLATGADVLWRVSASFTLPVNTHLHDGTYLSQLRGTRTKQRATVRVIEYSILGDDGISEVFALITNVVDPDEAPALELARDYSERWHIELLFRLVKVDLRTPGGVLRSRGPQGVRQELWALLCLYQALRTLITRAAVIAGVDATRISFPPALDAVTDSVGRAFSPS